jgi:hypothetical protein
MRTVEHGGATSVGVPKEHGCDLRGELLELEIISTQHIVDGPLTKGLTERKTSVYEDKLKCVQLHGRMQSRDAGSTPAEAKRVGSAAGWQAYVRAQARPEACSQHLNDKYRQYTHAAQGHRVTNQLTARCSPRRGLHQLRNSMFDWRSWSFGRGRGYCVWEGV